jgi:hypothetical protein
MKLSKLILVCVFVGTLGVLGCGDDASDQANELCNRGLCNTNAALKEQCLDVVNACLNEPQVNQDECAITASQVCGD